MKKIKLSEVKINADTFADQAPSYYDFRKFGIGNETNKANPIISDCNITTINTGFYSALANCLNAPTAGAFILIHIKRVEGYIHQIAIAGSTIYIRHISNTIWSNWNKVAYA